MHSICFEVIGVFEEKLCLVGADRNMIGMLDLNASNPSWSPVVFALPPDVSLDADCCCCFAGTMLYRIHCDALCAFNLSKLGMYCVDELVIAELSRSRRTGGVSMDSRTLYRR